MENLILAIFSLTVNKFKDCQYSLIYSTQVCTTTYYYSLIYRYRKQENYFKKFENTDLNIRKKKF